MLILGHTGITLGAAVLLNSALFKNRPFTMRANAPRKQLLDSSQPLLSQHSTLSSKTSPLTSLATRFDIRLLLIGSLFPDIIDKPVGIYFFRDTFSNGRIFCHTLLFVILIALAGLYLYQSRRKLWLLVFSFGVFSHLVLDQMWLNPRTLFWPLYGFSFEPEDLTDWVLHILRAPVSNPALLVSELIGGAILLWFIALLVRNRTVWAFIKQGKV